MYWHMSGVAEVTACGNQQHKKKKRDDSGWRKHIVGLFMRPQSSLQSTARPDAVVK